MLSLWAFLCGLEGIFFLLLLLGVETDAKNVFFLGYSGPRLFLAALILLMSLAFLAIAIFLLTKATIQSKFFHRVTTGSNPGNISLICLFVFTTGVILLLLPDYRIGWASSYFERLRPLLYWLVLISFQSGFVLLISLEPKSRQTFWWVILDSNPAIKIGLLVFVVFLTLYFSISYYFDMGRIHPKIINVPLLSIQVILGIFVLLFFRLVEKRIIGWRFGDGMLFLLIWVIAGYSWAATPMTESYFARGPYPPNNLIYPYSDSSVYDTAAQFTLHGWGVDKRSTSRPIYETFVAVLHFLFGAEYQDILIPHALILAVIPAIAYQLGKDLKNRSGGVLAAIFIIVKQMTAMELRISAVHVKLIMTEGLAMLGTILFTWVLIRFLVIQRDKYTNLLLASGILGLTSLVRLAAWFLFPIELIAGFLAFSGQRKKMAAALSMIILGFMLAIAPWAVRGQIIGDNDLFIMPKVRVVLERWGLSEPKEKPGQPVVVDVDEETSRVSTTYSSTWLKLIQDVPRHYLINIFSGLLSLPTTFTLHNAKQVIQSLSNWLQLSTLPLTHWTTWLLLSINVFIFGLGIGNAWLKVRWAGFLPLAVLLFYHVGNASARSSGGRYLVPVDWVTLLYYALGLCLILDWLWLFIASLYSSKHPTQSHDVKPNDFRGPMNMDRKTVVVALFIFCLGVFPVVFERLFVKEDDVIIQENKLVSPSAITTLAKVGLSQDQVNEFLQDPAAMVIKGYLLNPVFGEQDEYHQKYATSFPYLSFELFSQKREFNGVLPLSASPATIPQGSWAIILACHPFREGKAGTFVWGLIILAEGNEKPILYVREPYAPLACPLPFVECQEDGSMCKNLE